VLAGIIGALRACTVAMISALSMPCRRDAEVGMPQLALDDIERHPFVGELDGVGVTQLVGREPPPHPGFGGDAPEPDAGGVARPGPATGPSVDHAQQRPDGHAHMAFWGGSGGIGCFARGRKSLGVVAPWDEQARLGARAFGSSAVGD
jgi:hypothetical protein